MRLSERVCQIVPSATLEISSRVAELKGKGADIISFSVGEPDFNTPQKIIDACTDAMNKGLTKYTQITGILPLRSAICDKLERDNNVRYSPDEIVVSTGAKQAIYNAILALVNPGDEVIVPKPCWVSYVEMIKLAGGKPVLVENLESDKFLLNVSAIRAAVTDRTRAILVNSPNNPTGAVYTEESLRELADIAVENDIFVISDEVYEKLVYGDTKHFCIASVSEEMRRHSVIVNGLSKACSMTGWRMGYSAAPREISKAISSIQGHTTSNSTSFVQYASIVALTKCGDEIEKMRQEFAKRREILLEALRGINGITCADADGAFYLMPNVSSFYGKSAGGVTIKDSADLCKYLLDEAHVAVVPGSAFMSPANVRISYSNSVQNIEKGIAQIKDALENLK
ncbi:MAG: pyridoxal phosphate-dependent aminotransferase [Synergistaceae bacterium]|nr:pyridoxal phosphate-dependent aminotransferase [Synergistaceae bacterium]